jgi:L-iditol 2-dehydrogenase
VSVVQTGLCRTDIQAMTGQRAVAPGRILGHESTGVLAEVPATTVAAARAVGLREGDRVALFPFLPCQQCPACRDGERLGRCWAPIALGLDVDGGFADTLAVPLTVLRPAPAELDWSTLAYVEPVTAAMAVLDVPAVLAGGRVGVVGSGRIASLTEAVLRAAQVDVTRLAADDTTENAYAALIETQASEALLAQAVRALRPGGTLVIKSRPAAPAPWPHQAMVFKRVVAVGAPYGDFDQALAWLASGQLPVAPLLGDTFPLTAEGVTAALALEAASQETAGKLFLRYPGRA